MRLGAVRPSAPTLATIGLLSVSAVWGSTFVVIKDVVGSMPFPDFLAVRFAVAAVAMLAIAPRSVGRLMPTERTHGVVLGLLYRLAQIIQTAGLQHTSASVSGFVTGMYVVFTPLFAGVLFRHSVGARAWSAVGLATAGLALISLRGFGIGYGELLTLGSAALYAVHIIGLGVWSIGRSSYGLSVVQMWTIAVVCAVAALPGGITRPPTHASWLAGLYTGLVAGARVLVGQTCAQAQLASTRAAVVMTMEPVFAAVFAVAFGGERPDLRTIAGAALVLAATYRAELAPRRGVDATAGRLA